MRIASSLRMADQIVLLKDGIALSGTPDRLAGSGDPRIVDFLGADGSAYAESQRREGGSS